MLVDTYYTEVVQTNWATFIFLILQFSWQDGTENRIMVLGIIAEYNPFHNGHKYLIDYAKNELKADYVIIAMSGDYVQRGEPAIFDKYVRAKVSVINGADAVFVGGKEFSLRSQASNFTLEDIKEAVDELTGMSKDEELRRIAELREKAIRDEKSIRRTGLEEDFTIVLNFLTVFKNILHY